MPMGHLQAGRGQSWRRGLHRHPSWPLGSLTNLHGDRLQLFQGPADEHNIEASSCELGVGTGKPQRPDGHRGARCAGEWGPGVRWPLPVFLPWSVAKLGHSPAGQAARSIVPGVHVGVYRACQEPASCPLYRPAPPGTLCHLKRPRAQGCRRSERGRCHATRIAHGTGRGQQRF